MLLYTNADRAWAAPKACVTNGLIKAACAYKRNTMSSPKRRKVATEATNTVVENNTTTINCSIINAYVKARIDPITGKTQHFVVIKLGAKVPTIEYDAVNKTASEVEIDEIQLYFRAFVAQLIACRSEVAELYQTVQFAKDADKPRMLAAFVRLMTRDAVYDIDPVQYIAGEQFENGTIARFDGYTYSISSVKFADAVEVKLQPKSLDDDLAAFGL